MLIGLNVSRACEAIDGEWEAFDMGLLQAL